MNTDSCSLLGILGGLGPMSGICFCEMLTAHTYAKKDSDHINFLLSSRATTPDRSSFILGLSHEDPAPIMINEANRLKNAGADIIAIPCNTAHYFYRRICDSVDIPIINIIEETASFCEFEGLARVSVLATEGTISSGAYSDVFSARGIDIIPLYAEEQAIITNTIFNEIKSGAEPDVNRVLEVCDALRARGCERIILGCTELSLIRDKLSPRSLFVDSLEVLALAAISRCGKTPIGFDDSLMNFYAKKGK